MKVNFVNVKYLKINDEEKEQSFYEKLQGQEFTFNPKTNELDLYLKSNASVKISLDRRKFYVDSFDQK